jgi:Phosphotransferase enzyme family
VEIPQWVGSAASSQLGSEIASVDWSSGRVGIVWAVQLTDGRRCVIKSRPEQDGLLERLQALAEVQGTLAAAAVPVPNPVAPPLSANGRILTFESLMTATATELSHPDARKASLSMLLRIVEAGEALVAPTNLRSVSAWVDSNVEARNGSTWPTPHDTALFGPTFAGASEVITDLAVAAAAELAEWWRRPEHVLGHDDWEAQNLVFGSAAGQPRVVSIFDTEAFALMPEPVLAGSSGLQHGRGLPDSPDAPAIVEVEHWITNFASRRGGRSADWFRAAWAAAGWLLAYNARCDELLAVEAPDSHLEACRRDGDSYRARFG